MEEVTFEDAFRCAWASTRVCMRTLVSFGTPFGRVCVRNYYYYDI